jgi:hypothetical protein
VFEAWRVWRFYDNVTSSRDVLLSLRSDLDLQSLQMSDEEVTRIRDDLQDASGKLKSARSFASNDPFLFIGAQLPFAGKNASALRDLVKAAEAASRAGVAASDVILDYNQAPDNPDKTSIQEAIEFLQNERPRMVEVRKGVDEMSSRSKNIDSGIAGPLADAHADLEDATAKLEGLLDGYEKAQSFLPGLLGYDGSRRYLLLMQNDTEIMPSGGLISNYGVATFDQGLITSLDFEYFVNLFDRWQEISGGEYVEPPRALQDYLLHDITWALGEAGWYPDFPTTAKLSNEFVEKGGVQPGVGTIAIDLQFVQGVLSVLGPIDVPDWGVTVTAENLSEVTLQETRFESNQPGKPQKAFLSAFAREVLQKIFTMPRDRWVSMLKEFGKAGEERHLQINFDDQQLQDLSEDYALDGAIVRPEGDYLMFADSCVLSTKLNLIVTPSVDYTVQLRNDGQAFSLASYTLQNPFDKWKVGRDPQLVRSLMIDGVYGSYLRLYTQPGATLREVRVDGTRTSAEHIDNELDKKVFSKFSRVAPAETRTVSFVYSTPDVVEVGDVSRYTLYVQKQPGMQAPAFKFTAQIPEGSTLVGMTVDGKAAGEGMTLTTDLSKDRVITVEYRNPG